MYIPFPSIYNINNKYTVYTSTYFQSIILILYYRGASLYGYIYLNIFIQSSLSVYVKVDFRVLLQTIQFVISGMYENIGRVNYFKGTFVN